MVFSPQKLNLKVYCYVGGNTFFLLFLVASSILYLCFLNNLKFQQNFTVMKSIWLSLLIPFMFLSISDRNINPTFDKANCTCKGIPLYGNVKVVESFADFDVKVVEAFPDIEVKVVEAFPDACGKWKFVDAFPDFTIRYVDAFPDFTVRYVEAFPGTK